MSRKIIAFSSFGTFLIVILFFWISFAEKSIELYSGVAEDEANQMVSLLMVNQIDAQKVSEGSATAQKILVKRAQFVKAVEILRQNGFPKRRYLNVNDLFSSNQLVSSPGQESAKFSYLKEQKLEELLACLDGVMEVHVIISEAAVKSGSRENVPPCTASVFIKHSSEVNLDTFITQIKSLARTSVSGLEYENISVVLQGAQYRGQIDAAAA